MISIIIPTLPERREMLGEAVRQLTATAGHPLEFIIEHDHTRAGDGWREGATKASGEYLCFLNDDMLPMRGGWAEDATLTADAGCVVSPMLYDAASQLMTAGGWWDRLPLDGELTSATCIAPFLRHETYLGIASRLGASPWASLHYFSDNFFTSCAWSAGVPVRVRHGYAFRHLMAKGGRGDEAARIEAERPEYVALMRRYAMSERDRPEPLPAQIWV